MDSVGLADAKDTDKQVLASKQDKTGKDGKLLLSKQQQEDNQTGTVAGTSTQTNAELQAMLDTLALEVNRLAGRFGIEDTADSQTGTNSQTSNSEADNNFATTEQLNELKQLMYKNVESAVDNASDGDANTTYDAGSGLSLTGEDNTFSVTQGSNGIWNSNDSGDLYYEGGNIGVGTNDPSNNLDIYGDQPGIQLTSTRGTGSIGGGLSFKSDKDGKSMIMNFDRRGCCGRNSINFTAYDGSGYNFVQSIWLDGRVRWGWYGTGPGGLNFDPNKDADETLSVTGSSSSQPVLRLNSSSGQTGNIQEWRDSNGNALSVVGSDGSLGVSTSSPSDDLSVDGETTVTGTTKLATDGGKVGVGTSSPSNSLQVEGSTDVTGNFTAANKTLEVDGSGSGDFPAIMDLKDDNGDIRGGFVVDKSDGASFGNWAKNTLLIRTAGGAYGGVMALPTPDRSDGQLAIGGVGKNDVVKTVRMRPAPDNRSDVAVALGHESTNYANDTSTGGDVLRVMANDTVGMNKDSPSYSLHVSTPSDGAVAGFTDSNGTCTINPTNTALDCSSDRALKKDITSLTDNQDILDNLDQLNPVTYRWNEQANTEDKQYGLVAQDVEDVFPELVSEGTDGYKSLSYTSFIPVNTAAINQLNNKVDNIDKDTNADFWKDSQTASSSGTSTDTDTDNKTLTDTFLEAVAEAVGGVVEQGKVVFKELTTDTLVVKNTVTAENVEVEDTVSAGNKICVDGTCIAKDKFEAIASLDTSVFEKLAEEYGSSDKVMESKQDKNEPKDESETPNQGDSGQESKDEEDGETNEENEGSDETDEENNEADDQPNDGDVAGDQDEEKSSADDGRQTEADDGTPSEEGENGGEDANNDKDPEDDNSGDDNDTGNEGDANEGESGAEKPQDDDQQSSDKPADESKSDESNEEGGADSESDQSDNESNNGDGDQNEDGESNSGS
jgi:hypothetical protein